MKIHVGFAIYIYARAVNSKWDWQHLKTFLQLQIILRPNSKQKKLINIRTVHSLKCQKKETDTTQM